LGARGAYKNQGLLVRLVMDLGIRVLGLGVGDAIEESLACIR